MRSCIYRGHVEHHRRTPVDHRFRYALFWLYLDLDELPQVLQSVRLLSTRRFALASYCRGDHHGASGRPLQETIREFVHGELGLRVTGPVHLLTQLRHLGFYFSPLNLYYCFDDAGATVKAVVAEVSNTPWNERHYYLLWDGNQSPGSACCFSHPKAFHVSPFMEMNLQYDWCVELPAAQLRVSLACRRGEQQLFHARMELHRETLGDGPLARAIFRFPIAGAQILAAIHLQALRLWMKKCPIYPHPKKIPSPHCRAV